MDRAVDLRSDTVTRPPPGMRRAMARAEVDDDVLGKDPTVDRLEQRVAELLGKPSALFFPSGTQANQTAMVLHSRPGTEAVCEAESHVYHYEFADAAWLSGVQLHPVPSNSGRLTAADVARAIRPGDRHHPVTSLIWIENTHNMHGGIVVPVDAMRGVRSLARERGLPVHLDGARLWNASAASGTSLIDFAGEADTVMVCVSKGLGCPVGSLLAGPRELIEEAWSVRKRLGGGMRQVGILAAAGLWALEHIFPRLPEDHARARALAEGCRQIEGLNPLEPETNILMVDITRSDLGAEELAARLAEKGVMVIATGPTRLRLVTHFDVDDDGVEFALKALRDELS
ncbi:MAG: GntG family PLP-dependent aldolase [Gemmatimonadota bacterium]